MSTLVISDFKTGYETGVEPFLLNNDSFPVLNNAYIFRRRIQKKRGNQLLGRLRRDLDDQDLGNTDGAGNFSGNIKTILSLESNAQIVPGSITIIVGGQTFTEPASPNGTLTNGGAGTGTINYSSGALTLNTDPNLAATQVLIDFGYYPTLPVMGLEDFDNPETSFPDLVAFDTKYSYQFNQSSNIFYDTTFYKASQNPFVWSGDTYQQFYSANYENVMWVTNNKPGFHFKNVEATTFDSPAPGQTTIQITNHGLTSNDYVFFNEFTVGGGAEDLNLGSFQVTVLTANTFWVAAATTANTAVQGIAQYLTQAVSDSQDGIKWYDGDPIGGVPPNNKGWVNFSPPLSNVAQPEYLVGAKIVIPFKDRLLFFGVWKQTSIGSANFYQDLMIYSQNGTPFYSNPLPSLKTVDPQAWFRNVAAKGGDLRAPNPEEIFTVDNNEDVLICGFEDSKRKLIYTGDDSFPFFYQTINNELGTSSTFSSISLDQGIVDIGPYGISFTSSTSSQRIDLQIPDAVFNISALENGNDRVTAFRDYRNEFIYFTYVPKNRNSDDTFHFPNKTLLYNYRDNNWATFDENYTHYGFFRKSTGFTWATLPYRTWSSWTLPWNFGGLNDRFPSVIGGNQQGFVMITDVGTQNDTSQYVSNISGTTFTSPDHCLSPGEFIEIFDPVNFQTSQINGVIKKIISVTDRNTFVIEGTNTGSFNGGTVYRRIQRLEVRSKMFPTSWGLGRRTRISVQRYLCDNAPEGQLTITTFVNQSLYVDSNSLIDNSFSPYLPIISLGPNPLYPGEENQSRLWHRMNNSFIGDTVQVGFTLSDDQLRNIFINAAEIAVHAIVLQLHPAGII